jgi:acetolactate synthase-1/2/3 large subunit
VSEQAMTAKTDSHPLAGTRMSGADMVVQVLADEGVDTIFGYSGGAILPTYDAVFRYNDRHRRDDGSAAIPLIVPANEQGAGFMASGYARASGKVGVVMVTSGPGATNTVTPVRDCMADSIPIVVICGQVPRPAIGTRPSSKTRFAARSSWPVRAGPARSSSTFRKTCRIGKASSRAMERCRYPAIAGAGRPSRTTT